MNCLSSYKYQAATGSMSTNKLTYRLSYSHIHQFIKQNTIVTQLTTDK